MVKLEDKLKVEDKFTSFFLNSKYDKISLKYINHHNKYHKNTDLRMTGERGICYLWHIPCYKGQFRIKKNQYE